MNSIEEENLAFVEDFVSRNTDIIPSGAIIMVTGSEELISKELALYKRPTTSQELYEFEKDSAIVAEAGSGLAHEEDTVLFVTVE